MSPSQPLPPDDHQSASLMSEDPSSMPPDPNAAPTDDAPGAPGFASILITPAEQGGFAVTVTKAGAKPGDPNTSDNATVGSMDDIAKYLMSELAGGGPGGQDAAAGGGMAPQA
jgi:hypothetical protein